MYGRTDRLVSHLDVTPTSERPRHEDLRALVVTLVSPSDVPRSNLSFFEVKSAICDAPNLAVHGHYRPKTRYFARVSRSPMEYQQQKLSYRQSCLVMLLLIPFVTTAQSLPKSKTLTVEDGLGFRDVTAIVQDAHGLMWIGTRQGLNRYDGYRVIRFGDKQLVDQYLPCENIFFEGLQIINDSTLWINADNRLYQLNTRTFAYEDITASSGINGEFWLMKKGRDGSVWIVWDNPEKQYLCRSAGNEDFKIIATEPRLRREFTSLAIDTLGNAWWSTVHGGLKQYSPDGELLHAAKPDSFKWEGTIMHYTPLYVDGRNRLFVLPKGGYQVWLYHPDQRKIEIIKDSLPSVGYYMMEDQLGNMWFSSKTGLFRWSVDRTWTDFTRVLQSGLQYSNIQGLYEDRTNLIWVATDNGLILFPNQKQLFETRFTIKGVGWGNAMRAIFDDRDGNLYAFCENGTVGLHRTDPDHIGSDKVFLRWTDEKLHNLLGEARHFIPDHPQHSVWTLTDSLMRIDLATMEVRESIEMEGISSKFSNNPFIRLRDGRFLIGSTLKRLSIFDVKTGEMQTLIKEPQAHFEDVDTRYFLERKDGTLWIATASDGLYLIGRDGKIIQHLSTETTPALSNDHLLTLCDEGDSLLWIGTFGGGLNCLDIHRQTITLFNQKDGLTNDNVTGILIDRVGNIWSSTYNGLSCYVRNEGVFQNFFEEEGLPHNEFNYSSSFKDRTGRLWFGGMNGVIGFDSREVLEIRPNLPLAFTSFSRYNRMKDTLSTELLGQKDIEPIRISPYDSYFQLEWILPNYFRPDKNRYYVWLEGLDNDWSFIGNTPSIRYHTLAPGQYTLRVKGADSKGNWSASELSVPIDVRPFFYTTWWFISLCILFVGTLMYAFARYRLNRLLEIERMRTRIAGDLHDELGSMLSGIAMQAELLEMHSGKADSTKLHRLSEISRGSLSKMRDVVWSIDSRRDQVKNLLDRMREGAEELLLPKDIAFSFELGVLPLEKKIPVDVRQHLFLFFKEAITNVAKHAKATAVTIRFGHFDNHFELSIMDNGTSIKQHATSTGLGLQNMEMRAGKLGATFEVNRDEGFKVSMKMKGI